jgi:hypothetical protein
VITDMPRGGLSGGSAKAKTPLEPDGAEALLKDANKRMHEMFGMARDELKTKRQKAGM